MNGPLQLWVIQGQALVMMNVWFYYLLCAPSRASPAGTHNILTCGKFGSGYRNIKVLIRDVIQSRLYGRHTQFRLILLGQTSLLTEFNGLKFHSTDLLARSRLIDYCQLTNLTL